MQNRKLRTGAAVTFYKILEIRALCPIEIVQECFIDLDPDHVHHVHHVKEYWYFHFPPHYIFKLTLIVYTLLNSYHYNYTE